MTPHEETILHHLQRIEKKLDTLNGHVTEHDRWIAAREPVCTDHTEEMSAMRKRLSNHQSYIDTHRGSRSGISSTVQFALTVLMWLTAIAAIVWRD